MAFGGFAGTATGDSSTDYVSGHLHASYLLEQGGWYVKPLIEGMATHINSDGLTETGGGGAALVAAGESDTILSVSPAVEIGNEYRFIQISIVRPFIRAGVTWRDGDDLDLRGAFAAAPAGAGAFVISTAMDDLLANVSAGFDVINLDGAVPRLQYDGRFGEETQRTAPASRAASRSESADVRDRIGKGPPTGGATNVKLP
jgi:uncharacterized protein with beta-barrel porin domain